MSTRKVKFDICGSSYIVNTTDSEEYVLEAARTLDKDMGKILDSIPSASVTAAAIITAIGYWDESCKSIDAASNMRTQIQDYLEDALRARQQAEDTRKELDTLRQELDYLKQREHRSIQHLTFSRPAVQLAKTDAVSKVMRPSSNASSAKGDSPERLSSEG